MPKERVVIQPGPIFYEVFAGLLKAQGTTVSDFAKRHSLSITNLKFMASGASNGPKSKKIRDLMLKEIGTEMFQPMYERRLVKECDGSSQNKVATRLGISAAAVSQVIRKSYLGSYDNVAMRVREIYMDGDIDCPAIGEIASEICLHWRDEIRRGTSSDPQRVLMTRFCRKCPRNMPRSTKAETPAPEADVKLVFKSRRFADAQS